LWALSGPPTRADNPAVTTLKSITPHLKTNDLDATIRFYTEMLAFSVEVTWPSDRPANCILHRDDVSISFTTDPNRWYPPPCLAGQLWIEVEDVMALHARIAGKVNVEWGPEIYSYGRREFAIKDCNGYLLAFSEPVE
jgi:catechol 2,3-dioxygenase-like lactoylglutathione lyase family enzyme